VLKLRKCQVIWEQRTIYVDQNMVESYLGKQGGGAITADDIAGTIEAMADNAEMFSVNFAPPASELSGYYATEWEMYMLRTAGRLGDVKFVGPNGIEIPNPFK
jgi:hypothetical protein